MFSTKRLARPGVSGSTILGLIARQLRRHAALLLVPAIVACSSVAPGPQFSGSVAQSGATDAAQPPSTEIKPITSKLLQDEKANKTARSSANLNALMASPVPYTIEKGDILNVIVWDHPELSGGMNANRAISTMAAMDMPANQMPGSTFTVGHDGSIQFPYVGVLKIAGLTEDQAREMLTSRLGHYINKPNVTLSVQSYRSKRIYVDGEVKTPGVQTINDIPMTLLEAVNRAGGFLPSADQSQIMLNRGGSMYHINLPELVKTGMDPAEIMLSSGDVVSVLSRDQSKVFVSGEVIVPRALQMHNGRLSLNEALGEAGGINPQSGDARQVYVIRRQSNKPEVYMLDAQTPDALALAEGFELYPKDIVYVAPTALTNWHRTISQMLPGALGGVVTSAIPQAH
ncbi:polysaccharide biosynthesis/export family protein [Noviherbaspirillum pedocola]|uniref:Polysaccharide biosynthesis/export family protein n=1 Tax=Noviherbaspirillum pedocola TaxID=2801341 RepID=A0A934W8Y9_9BURK|nr:polysaccharide biosynthesis/export family protein [Noviherbaspirillum pedocola]MBK4738145.1 polysaccharide biosynthesis/export family protein [Noviherbaspirillum pedocola]